MQNTLLVHPDDHMVVALTDLPAGAIVQVAGESIRLTSRVPAKHKFTRRPCQAGDFLKMYGLIVGQAVQPMGAGEALSTSNLKHAVSPLTESSPSRLWQARQCLDRVVFGLKPRGGLYRVYSNPSHTVDRC